MLHVEVSAFEGPLDLLLQLIRKNEIPIEDIPIAEITDAYVSILEDKSTVREEEMGDFLVLASELLYIKSRILLPVEEEEEEDPREALVKRLQAYEAFLAVSKTLQAYEKAGAVRLSKLPSDLSAYSTEPVEITKDVGALYLAFRDALQTRAREEASREAIGEIIEREVFEVETAIETLLDAPLEKLTPLGHFVRTQAVGEWIALFIAMLELMKRNILQALVKQNEIYLHRREAY